MTGDYTTVAHAYDPAFQVFDKMQAEMEARARAKALLKQQERDAATAAAKQKQMQLMQQATAQQKAAPSGVDRANQENDAIARQKLAQEEAATGEEKERLRYQRVSGKEGESRRKEFESKSSARASKATGGISSQIPRPSVNVVSPQNTILGLPKNNQKFTKFGESINRAANLTYSNPQARVGGM